MKNIRVEAVDHIPSPILAIGNSYPDGHVVAPHQHRRGQLISCASGVIVVATSAGAWVTPPQRGVWIPPATMHEVRMLGAVSMQSLYLEPDTVPGLPERCQVVGISPFMRGLMTEALDLPAEYGAESRGGALMALIRHEMRELAILPLALPYPASAALAARCRAFAQRPDIHARIDEWSDALGMSRRAFTRFFRAETGLSFVAWRQQACLMTALPRLAAGSSVTTVASDLGYDNPTAFTTMFKRTFGAPPLAYLKLRGEGSRA